MNKTREDKTRGTVVKLAVEVDVDLDRRMRLYAVEQDMSLWEVWEKAGRRLVDEKSRPG